MPDITPVSPLLQLTRTRLPVQRCNPARTGPLILIEGVIKVHEHLALFVGIFLASIVAGTFGALLGLGGGIIIIPVLTIIFKVPMKEAIAASLVSVIATSTSAAILYVEHHYTNVRLGMTLEMATTIGAILGGERRRITWKICRPAT